MKKHLLIDIGNFQKSEPCCPYGITCPCAQTKGKPSKKGKNLSTGNFILWTK